MTLIELMVATGAGTLVAAVVASMFLYFGKSFATVSNYVELDAASRKALDIITSDIRQANKMTSYTPNQIQFQTVAAGVTNTFSYNYDASAATLTRVYAGVSSVLLTEIRTNTLSFAMFQRNPVGGTVDQYTTTNPALCKVVQLNWVCTRKVLGRESTTESVQSAKVVIRKE